MQNLVSKFFYPAIGSGLSRQMKLYPKTCMRVFKTASLHCELSLVKVWASSYLRESDLSLTHVYVMGYHWNCVNKPVLMPGAKFLLTWFSIHHRLNSCDLTKFSFYIFANIWPLQVHCRPKTKVLRTSVLRHWIWRVQSLRQNLDSTWNNICQLFS